MTQMLPLLWQFVHDRQNMPYTTSQHIVPLCDHGCAAHKACKDGAPKIVDFTMCNAHGTQLSASIDNALADMHKERVFESWLQLNASAANLYGGHTFDAWVPPRS